MYVVRNVFRAKPGQADELVRMFRSFLDELPQEPDGGRRRILTDASAGFWTVVLEEEVDDLASYFHTLERADGLRGVERLTGYQTMVESGYREILRVDLPAQPA